MLMQQQIGPGKASIGVCTRKTFSSENRNIKKKYAQSTRAIAARDLLVFISTRTIHESL